MLTLRLGLAHSGCALCLFPLAADGELNPFDLVSVAASKNSGGKRVQTIHLSRAPARLRCAMPTSLAISTIELWIIT